MNVPRAVGLLEALAVYPDPGVRRLASAALEALEAEPLPLEAQAGDAALPGWLEEEEPPQDRVRVTIRLKHPPPEDMEIEGLL